MKTNDFVALRKLALKSKMPVGKFAGTTVERLLENGHERYLQFVYYRYERISYIDEVLDRIGIRPEMRIEKPGVDMDMLKKLRIEQWDERFENVDEEVKRKVIMGRASHNKRVRRIRSEIRERYRERENGAGRLQWKNQGH